MASLDLQTAGASGRGALSASSHPTFSGYWVTSGRLRGGVVVEEEVMEQEVEVVLEVFTLKFWTP